MPSSLSEIHEIGAVKMNFKTHVDEVCDVLIIGAGPAGIAAAIGITEADKAAKVIVLELGRPFQSRNCPVDHKKTCKHCSGICNVISGFGGSIHYGDGLKLSMLPSGKRLISAMGDLAHKYSWRAFDICSDAIGYAPRLDGTCVPEDVRRKFHEYGLRIKEYPVALVSERNVNSLLEDMHNRVKDSVSLRMLHKVEEIRKSEDKFVVSGTSGVVRNKSKFTIKAKNIIIASGRAGLRQTEQIFDQFNLRRAAPRVSVGVRYEMDAKLLAEIGTQHPDLKLSASFSDSSKTKTFCFCGGENGGRIKFSSYQDNFSKPVILLDGHASADRKKGEKNIGANFSVLYQHAPAEGGTIEWLEENVLKRYYEIADGRPIAQTYREFKDRKCGTLDFISLTRKLPFDPSVMDYKHGPVFSLFDDTVHTALIKMFEDVMSAILRVNGIGSLDDISNQILVSGLELEFPWTEVPISEHCETSIPGLFVVGDSAGYAQGIIQAMTMGLAAGERIVERSTGHALCL